MPCTVQGRRPCGIRKAIVQSRDNKRIAKVVAAAVLATVVVAAALVVAGAVREAGTLTSVLGWVAPILAGVAVGFIADIILESREDGESSGERVRVCEACGAELLDDWRMCPTCGAFVDEETKSSRREHRAHTVL